jgi:hypothetical protein
MNSQTTPTSLLGQQSSPFMNLPLSITHALKNAGQTIASNVKSTIQQEVPVVKGITHAVSGFASTIPQSIQQRSIQPFAQASKGMYASIGKTLAKPISMSDAGAMALGFTGDNVGSLDNLSKLDVLNEEGSSRIVYDQPKDNSVIKVARDDYGIQQNKLSVNNDAEKIGLIPKTISAAKDYSYVIKEKVNPPDANVKSMIKEMSNLDFGDGKLNENTQGAFDKAIKIMNKYGYNGTEFGYTAPDAALLDLQRLDNWGTKNGKPILLDEGAFDVNSMRQYDADVVNWKNDTSSGNALNDYIKKITSK